MLRLLLGTLLIVVQTQSWGSKLNDSSLIPHVGERARNSYMSFLYADEHRAFAIGPGGAWAWKSGYSTREKAKNAAINACQSYSDQSCIPYAIDTDLVFNRDNWNRLWGPYKSRQQASESPFGNSRGNRFYNLKFTNAFGKQMSMSDLLGKIVLVHFWGSWCPSCMNEYPSLYRMRKILKEKMGDDIELIILQVREPFENAVKWVEKNRYTDMPLYDSGVKDENDGHLMLANGEKISDRKLASRFPSSFVLDRNGVVVFAHQGPVLNWLEYIPFFEHLYEDTQSVSR